MKITVAQFIFACCFFILSTELVAQKKVGPADVLQSDFINPPVSAKPYVWWHWMGSNFSKTGITKDLEAMKAQGIGGATIFNIASAVQESHVPTLNNPWPEQTYRSPAYWEAIQHAAAEAKRLGLEIGLHNTAGYSTTGGPWIDQERGMKKLVWKRIVVKDRDKSFIKISQPDPVTSDGWGSKGLPPAPSTWYKDIAYLAIPLADSARFNMEQDFTSYFDTSGIQIKALPTGDWIIYRLGYAPTMSVPHPLPDDIIGKTFEADKMSAAQSEYHWNQVLDPVKKYLGQYLGNSFKHMLIDSYEAGYQNWTPDFRDQFIKIKGYDPLPWILSFTSSITNEYNVSNNGTAPVEDKRIRISEEQTARFDWDYKDVINQLYFENGWNIGKKKLQEAGLQLQFEAYGGPFSTPEGSAMADIPMGEFWSNQKGSIGNNITAAARAAGRTIVGAEAFTGSPALSQFTEDPAFLKPSATGAFASGVNRLILHHWVHQPFDDQYQPGMGMGWWGTHFGRNQTWAVPGKAFFTYLARTQAMLQYGEQVADYLCLETPLNDRSDVIAKNDFLQQEIKVADGKLILASGRIYPFIVLPKGNKILPEVLQKLKQLVKQGATIVGSKPNQSLSLKNFPACDTEVLSMANELWGSGKQNQFGKGFVFKNINDAIAKFSMVPDYSIEQADSAQLIKLLHRTGKNGEVYFVANVHSKPQSIVVSFNIKNRQPEIWQAENGSITNAPIWKVENGRTWVQLKLNDFQSAFIVFRKPASKADHPTAFQIIEGNPGVDIKATSNNQSFISSPAKAKVTVTYASGKTNTLTINKATEVEINGSWKLKMQPKLEASFLVDFPSLADFSKHDDQRIRYFAGTAVYTKSISIDGAHLKAGKQVILDLGTVNDIVAVKINGKAMGVLWYPPYTMDVSGNVKAGINNLEIAVTNNWANRLIGDEQEPIDFEWGPDRGTNGRAMKAYPEWFIQNQPRPSKGRKTFSIWYYYRKDSPLKPAGLAGPVRLIYQDSKPL